MIVAVLDLDESGEPRTAKQPHRAQGGHPAVLADDVGDAVEGQVHRDLFPSAPAMDLDAQGVATLLDVSPRFDPSGTATLLKSLGAQSVELMAS